MKILIVGLLFVLLLFGCAKNSTVEEETIKIGISQPFTGGTAFIGERIMNGINLALDELPPEERARIEIVKEDDGCTGTIGVTAVQKLLNVDKVDYLIGPTCNAASVPTIDLVREAGISQLTTGVVNDVLVNAGDHHFSLLPKNKDVMYALADYVYSTGVRRLSIFFLDDEFGVESVKHFETRFTSLGGTIALKESFGREETDYRTHIVKLQQTPVDALFMMSYGPFLINQLKQMDELGFRTTMYAPVPVQDQNLINQAGKLANGIIYPYPEDVHTEETEFQRTYRERYGVEPDVYPTAGTDSFNILWKLITECRNDKTCVQKKLSTLQNFPGVGGVISLDADGIAKRNIVMKQIVDGKFVTVE